MKNTTDLDADGTRWTTRSNHNFARWGATSVFQIPHNEIGMSGRGPTWVIKLEDGWHYAHADQTSSYAAKEAYDCTSAREAWLTHTLANAASKVKSAERALEEAITFKRLVEEARAACIAESNPWSHDALRVAFEKVADASDWKAAIRWAIPASEKEITARAIAHFTATEAEFRDIGNGRLEVRSIGYRAGPAGDH